MQMTTEARSHILCEIESVASRSLLVFKWIFLCMCARRAPSVQESVGAQFLPSLDFISTVCYCCSGNFPSMQTGNSPWSSNGSQILKPFRSDFLKAHSPFISAISNRKNSWTLDLCHCCYVCVPVHKDVGVFECTLFAMGKHFARLTDTWNSLKVRRSGVCSASSCVIPMP